MISNPGLNSHYQHITLRHLACANYLSSVHSDFGLHTNSSDVYAEETTVRQVGRVVTIVKYIREGVSHGFVQKGFSDEGSRNMRLDFMHML